MSDLEIIEKTKEYVKKTLSGEGTGHDWWHIERVWKMAKRIAGEEKDADIFVVELTALLHDIADWKFNDGNAVAGGIAAREWLQKLEVNDLVIQKVTEIIDELSFKGAGVKPKFKNKDGEIVYDADKLDAIGAIGIARAFAFGGHIGRELYNPNISSVAHKDFEEYRNKSLKSPTINHFYEKLLLLKDLMNTNTAKKIAEERHQYMEQFLERFYKEWDGQA